MNSVKMNLRHSVYGIFNDQFALDSAIDNLKAQNFKNTDISILIHKKIENNDLANEENSKAPEGATAGVATGAFAGSIFGWLIGAGILTVQGLGPLVAAGPIMAAIAGASIGGTVGGVAGGLIGLGIPEHEAKKYEDLVKVGGLLISIHIDDDVWEEKALDILRKNGAVNISSTSGRNIIDEDEYSRIDFEEDFDIRRNNPHA